MSWASKRKFIYFCIFILVIGIFVGLPVYSYLHKPATCADTKQNQGEEGVDCGGPCVNLCKPLELAPVTLWQQTFEVVSGVYTAVAYVQNPNINGEAFSVPYVFTIYDATNNVITTREGKTVIPPGKSFAVVETNIFINKRTPARTLFQFKGDIAWKAARKLPYLTVNNILPIDVGTFPTITAQVVNNSMTRLDKIIATVIVYDTDGNAFAASRTVIDSMAPQSTERIVFTWPQPFKKAISHPEVITIIQ